MRNLAFTLLGLIMAIPTWASNPDTSLDSTTTEESSDFSISILTTALAETFPEAMIVAGGDFFKYRQLSHSAVLIEHPQGNLLYDTGLGRTIAESFEQNNWFHKATMGYILLTPAIDQLAAENMSERDLLAIIPSHLHWDHIGGLPDFPNTPVWVSNKVASLKEAVDPDHAPAYLTGLISGKEQWKSIEFNEKEYQGFSRSKDIFNDGRLILVDLEGHTPGQVGLFVNLDSGKRYFLIGDTTWVQRGYIDNTPRPKIVDWFNPVDWKIEQNQQVVKKVHDIYMAQPDMMIIPAHDEVAAKLIPHFPKRGY